ncbi:hypothetical protein HER10_EVM0010722 [Colletotrichum scovillei]|uniref:Uncharacterized protein n=1 Tax=Colletotrichum scovillei TaxID=1209932 RepID=A0A9P7UK30_9PEZI|nr:uncharacterized protein HER10_EVM0010722 [Colletotrichum scovillei]KAF4783504.1 hypothetical protein HER10_EVM0010722 [Colletotrichum scovillei]KAG7053230.1 hypothetical protein JMJ77_0000320 [Colletotrichum scovillei]KAG7071524.1 hypothetical protein JMJ76_0004395 [Colletotrichum scovillei]KAG7079776.1 hypothetical protein JMJ78_0006880 [Colletotrichum scovillei]
MTTPQVSKADADLWLAYGVKLKNTFAQSFTPGDNSRFYIAPLSCAGIAAGRNINSAITNNGVYVIGDTLLSLDEPVFLPGRQSYFQRCLSYANSVELHSHENTVAQARYNIAQEEAREAQKRYQDAKFIAIKIWKKNLTAQITTDSFSQWCIQNYPMFSLAQSSNDAAAAAAAVASSDMNDPMAPIVRQYQSSLNAANGTSAIPGVTMTCSSASADQISSGQAGTPGAPLERPAYTITSQYPQVVNGWIDTFTQNSKTPTTITFKASDASSSSWQDLGYSNDTVQMTRPDCIFFSATYTENYETVTKTVTAEEAGSDLEVTITVTDFQSFPIAPGNWNPSQLAGLPIVANADPSLRKPMAVVNQAILAYGVGMEVKLSSSAASTINNYMDKASSNGGRASIFGFNIGLEGDANSTQTSTTTFDQVKSASSSTSFTIPPSDNSNPTLLGVIGQAIPLPNNA